MSNLALFGMLAAAVCGVLCFGVSRWFYRKGNDFLASTFMIPAVLMAMMVFLFVAVNVRF